MDYFSTGLLVVLTLQRSGASILLHEAGKVYSTALAVLLAEFIKQIICFCVAMYQIRREQNVRLPSNDSTSKQRFLFVVRDMKEAAFTFTSRVVNKNAWIVFIPAALFVVQNNLFLFASSRISPSTFQALWQLRLIPTAMFSQILLKKQLGIRQWLALCVILAGVIMIQQATQSDVIASAEAQKRSLTAILALALAAAFGSLAGVLLEKHFKEAGTNLWISNFQLSAFSLVPAALVVVLDMRKQDTASFASLTAFATSFGPWSAVLVQAFSGILVALTTKYAGCIAGSISGIASIAVTHLIELLAGSKSNSTKEISFLIGFVLVAAGVAWYTIFGKVPVKENSEPAPPTAKISDSRGAIHLEMVPTPSKEEFWMPLQQSDDDHESGEAIAEKVSPRSTERYLTTETPPASPFVTGIVDEDADLPDESDSKTHTPRQTGPAATTSPLL